MLENQYKNVLLVSRLLSKSLHVHDEEVGEHVDGVLSKISCAQHKLNGLTGINFHQSFLLAALLSSCAYAINLAACMGSCCRQGCAKHVVGMRGILWFFLYFVWVKIRAVMHGFHMV